MKGSEGSSGVSGSLGRPGVPGSRARPECQARRRRRVLPGWWSLLYLGRYDIVATAGHDKAHAAAAFAFAGRNAGITLLYTAGGVGDGQSGFQLGEYGGVCLHGDIDCAAIPRHGDAGVKIACEVGVSLCAQIPGAEQLAAFIDYVYDTGRIGSLGKS